ncbi:peptidase inhibitor family I36 protein [Paractinoplanes atraurantiacus]|uniref:Peptidase inhibitor family I36 n=1 Tax=Paractinoplanes atraurantiacus TaxID=1036182 RepID=A0A285GUI3_9ACTN|nr:peptidase inhibitor family I36 protein [Actinoplanes atraurantiacus]SNY26176.1 Peptidase inhibitor family I36 [Actinoplanes atraurantiacus]
MKLRTVLRSAAAAALLLTGTLAATPSAAQAAWQCQIGYVCFYENFDLRGSAAVPGVLSLWSGAWPGQLADFRNRTYTNGKNLNDSASSVYNRTGLTLYVFEHGDFNEHKSGRVTAVGPGQAWNFGQDEGMLQDNRASSARFFE